MRIIDYFQCDRPEYWLRQIQKCDWSAGQFLYELLSENKFKAVVGEKSTVLLLTDEDELISFCSYAEKDDIQPTKLTPWIGFVYTFPEHRGHRYIGRLFREIDKLAKKEKVQDVFISTDHTGLYEKYGCEFYQMMNDIHGEPSRVYKRHIEMILRTNRLLLRPWQETDAENLYKYASNPDVGPIAGWPPHKSVEESLEVIRNVFCGAECYAICLKEDETHVIGAIELKLNGHTDMTERDDECELGYWLGRPFWGQGIMPEAAEEMLRHAFEDLAMEKVWCGYYDGNDKSKRVQEKIGLRYQWTTQDVDVPLMHEKRTGHVNCMTKDEWGRAQA